MVSPSWKCSMLLQNSLGHLQSRRTQTPREVENRWPKICDTSQKRVNISRLSISLAYCSVQLLGEVQGVLSNSWGSSRFVYSVLWQTMRGMQVKGCFSRHHWPLHICSAEAHLDPDSNLIGRGGQNQEVCICNLENTAHPEPWLQARFWLTYSPR